MIAGQQHIGPCAMDSLCHDVIGAANVLAVAVAVSCFQVPRHQKPLTTLRNHVVRHSNICLRNTDDQFRKASSPFLRCERVHGILVMSGLP